MIRIFDESSDYSLVVFDSKRSDGFEILNEAALLKMIKSILIQKKFCVLTPSDDVTYSLLTSKHSHVDDQFIFLNHSIKNKIKSLVDSSSFNSFLNTRAYLKSLF